MSMAACNFPGPGTALPEAPPSPTPASLQPIGDCSEEAGGVLHQPVLVEVHPAEAAPGEQIKVIGSGGYVQCGAAYDESARSFQLYWDGEPIGEIGCYVNHCEQTVTVPDDAASGRHTLSAEGGSSVEMRVTRSD